jgi:hypothetical protein
VTAEYWHLTGPGQVSCSAEKGYSERARREWLCPGCLSIREGTGPLDVEIEEKRPASAPLQVVWGMGLTVAPRDFLDALGRDLVERELHVGKVIGDGKLLPDWVCFHPKQRVIVRGTTRALTRRCGTCGRDVYSAWEEDNLCPPPPPQARLMATATGGSLVVTGDVLAKIDRAKWKRLKAKRLDVLDEPRDGLPRDLKP